MPNFWKNLFSHDELTINVRQESDKVYAKILDNVRLGILNSEHYDILVGKKDTIEYAYSRNMFSRFS